MTSRTVAQIGVLTPKLAGDNEKIYVDADFSLLIPAGQTLVACSLQITRHDGADDGSVLANMKEGATQVSGLVASQLIKGGVAGCNYLLTFIPQVSGDNQTPNIQLILPVVGLRLG